MFRGPDEFLVPYGHRAFALPVETAWALHNESQANLSGIERSRFALSTEAGKMEMVSVIDGHPSARALGGPLGEALAEGLVVFRLHRSPCNDRQGDIVIARRNPDALWITGYEDRILYDGRKETPDEKFAPLLSLIEPSRMAAE